MRPQFSASTSNVRRRFQTWVKGQFFRYAPADVAAWARSTISKWRKLQQRRAEADGFADYEPTLFGGPPSVAPHFAFTVGTILDPFSESAWSSEFSLVALTPSNWRDELPKCDFILAESAWEGSCGQWRYQLTGTSAPSDDLRILLAAATDKQIPSVFWNKEDPVHYEEFRDTAKLFDYIFTTDENSLPRYQTEIGHNRVFVLPFAAQPRIHNPARRGTKEDVNPSGIAFAGTYFRHKFQDRRAQMDLLLGAAANVAKGYDVPFTIFSRHAGGDRKYQFPLKWSKYVSGSLPYSQMLTAYRRFALFLNVNSVTTSPSMCARRIFEIVASGTAVISTPSAAIRNFFNADEVPVVTDKDQAERAIRTLVNSPMLRSRMVHKAQRQIWERHTYAHRAATILDTLKLLPPQTDESPLVSVICSTNKANQIGHVIEQVAQQNYPNVELLLAGHGVALDSAVADAARDKGVSRIELLQFDNDSTLGLCLNELVQKSSGKIVAKFDDDDFYLPNYLRDQVNILRAMDADLVGKASIYFHLNSNNALVKRWAHREHTWYNFVAGATLVGWRDTFVGVPFPDRSRGEDSVFLKALEAKGLRVYSADSFNYIAVRRGSGHTWDISDTDILAYSEVETFGLNLTHVEV